MLLISHEKKKQNKTKDEMMKKTLNESFKFLDPREYPNNFAIH